MMCTIYVMVLVRLYSDLLFICLIVDSDYTSLVSLIKTNSNLSTINANKQHNYSLMFSGDIPSAPFLFGAFLVTIGFLLLPNSKSDLKEAGNNTRTIEQNARLLDIKEDTNGVVQIDCSFLFWLALKYPLTLFRKYLDACFVTMIL